MRPVLEPVPETALEEKEQFINHSMDDFQEEYEQIIREEVGQEVYDS
jgi:hypothetical protein